MPTAPPTDPHDLDEYVLDLVMRNAPHFERFEVSEIEYVVTRRSAATGGSVVHPDAEVIFFQVSGEFTIPGRTRRRPSGPPQEAEEVQLLSGCIDVSTGEGVDGGWGGPKVDMNPLGDVRRLLPPRR